jgi:hypothetical protein
VSTDVHERRIFQHSLFMSVRQCPPLFVTGCCQLQMNRGTACTSFLGVSDRPPECAMSHELGIFTRLQLTILHCCLRGLGSEMGSGVAYGQLMQHLHPILVDVALEGCPRY